MFNINKEETLTPSDLLSAFTTSIENLPFAYILKTYNGNVIEANAAARNLFGYTIDEFRQLKKENFLYFDEVSYTTFMSDRDAFKESSIKIWGIAKDKKKFSILLSSYNITLNHKKLVCLVITDIVNEQKEKKLTRSIEVLEETNRKVVVGNYEIDIVTGKIILSSVLKDIYDIPKSEDYEPDFDRGLLHYKEGIPRDTMRTLFKKAINEGIPFDTEVEIVTTNGIEKWVRITGNVEFNNGICTRLFGITQDITKQKNIQNELIREKKLLRTLIDDLPVAIFIKDAQARKLISNKKDVELMGLETEEQAIGKTDVEIYQSNLSRLSYSRDKEVISTGKHFVNTLEHFFDKNGNELYLHTSKYPSKNEYGEINGLVGIAIDVTEQKLVEQRLNLVDFSFKKASTAIFLSKPDASFYDFNEAAHNMLGYTKEEFSNLKVEDIDIYYNKEVWPDHWKALKKERSLNFDSVLKKKDGTLISVVINTNFIQLNGIELNFAFISDVTQQKQKEQRLNLVNFCFKQANVSIFLVKSDASFYDFNDTAHKSLGYTRNEFIHINVCNLNYNLSISKWDTHWQELKEKKTLQITTTHLKKDGAHIDVEINANYIVHNGVELNCSFITDITEKNKIARELQRSNERYEQAMIATSDAIWEVDLMKNELYLSSNFKLLFGYDTVGLHDNDLNLWGKHVHPDDFPKVIAITESILSTLQTTYTTEYRYQKANGEYVYIVDKVLIVRDQAGKAIRLVGAMQDVTKKEAEEERLRLLETVVTNSRDAIVITSTKPIDNADLPIIYANQAFTDISGFTQEDLVNKTPRISQGALTDKKELEKIRYAINNWQPCQIETINYKKNGEPYWVNISIVPVANESGWFTHWVSIQRDITARKQAEEAFREIYSLNKNILDSAEFSIISCDYNGLIMTFNPCAERLLGFTADEMIGKRTPEIFHDKDEVINEAKKLSEELGTVINSGFDVFVAEAKLGLVTEKEWTYINKNGDRFPVSLSISALHNELGDITGFLGIAKDITKEKAMKNELARSYAALEDIIHELVQQKYALDQHSIVSITDTKGIIIYANDNFCNISKYADDELVGSTHSITRSGIHSDDFFIQMITTISKGEVWKEEVCNQAKDGSLYWTDTTIVPYLDAKTNKPIRYISIESNITERKKVEQEKQQMLDELSHSNLELKQFTYITSHNLRAPLTNLISICKLLKTDKIEDTFTLKLIDGFKKSTTHLNETLNDLINILIIKEKRNLPVSALNINDMLNRVSESINAIIVNKGAIIESNFQLAPIVNFNNAYLESIFLNLITNSIKYAHPDRNPIIKISTSEGKDGSVVLFFSDNGLGMNMVKVKDKIFGLYQRFHTNDDSKGIGLYLIHSQITALGGKIEVESEENVGTTFTITFK